MTDRNYMNLPVPVEFLREMTIHLATLEQAAIEGHAMTAPTHEMQTQTSDPETGSQKTVRRRAGIVWNSNQWGDLQIKNSVSSLRVLRFVDRLPRDEQGAKPLSQLAEAAEMTDSELRAALSWLTRHLRSNPQVFPTDSWPFGWKVGPDVDPENPHEFHYWITDEQYAHRVDGIEEFLQAED